MIKFEIQSSMLSGYDIAHQYIFIWYDTRILIKKTLHQKKLLLSSIILFKVKLDHFDKLSEMHLLLKIFQLKCHQLFLELKAQMEFIYINLQMSHPKMELLIQGHCTIHIYQLSIHHTDGYY